MRKKVRDAVVFLNDHMVMASQALSPHDRGRLFEMIRAFAIEGTESDVSNESRLFRSLYAMMHKAQEKNIQKYEETCERNRIKALKRVRPSGAAGCRRQPLAAAAANTMQSNIKQSNTRQDSGCAGDNDSIREIRGVPGVAWL